MAEPIRPDRADDGAPSFLGGEASVHDAFNRVVLERLAPVSVALALGRLGDPKACDRLVLLAKNQDAGLRVRTMAVVALGLVFDPESPPSRARLRTFANYFSLTRHHHALLGIL